jgi:hypothetical protein
MVIFILVLLSVFFLSVAKEILERKPFSKLKPAEGAESAYLA